MICSRCCEYEYTFSRKEISEKLERIVKKTENDQMYLLVKKTV